METTLHRQLKALYCADDAHQEVQLDGYRIDAVPMMPRATTRRLADQLRRATAPREATWLVGEGGRAIRTTTLADGTETTAAEESASAPPPRSNNSRRCCMETEPEEFNQLCQSSLLEKLPTQPDVKHHMGKLPNSCPLAPPNNAP